MNRAEFLSIIGCLARFDMKTGNLVVFKKAIVFNMPGTGGESDFRVLGEDSKDKKWLLFSGDGRNTSRIKKVNVDII